MLTSILPMMMGMVVATATPTAPDASTVQTAQQADPTATQLEDIVVSGRRIDDQVRSFIDEVVTPPSGRGPARWHENVCVGVVNIRGEAAQYMADRVSLAALDIGLNPGEPGCRPNILIIGTGDGAGLARGLVDARRRVFWPGGSGMNRSRAALEAFQTGDQPVRWWHISAPVNADTGELAVRLPGEEAPTVARTTSGRLRTQIRNDLSRVIIIVDLTKAEGLNFQQLSDYVAMVAFSQVDPDADTSGFSTVLNLFRDPQAVSGLTDWDQSYLKALYAAELNQSAATHQAGEIQGLMARERKREAGLEATAD